MRHLACEWKRNAARAAALPSAFRFHGGGHRIVPAGSTRLRTDTDGHLSAKSEQLARGKRDMANHLRGDRALLQNADQVPNSRIDRNRSHLGPHYLRARVGQMPPNSSSQRNSAS